MQRWPLALLHRVRAPFLKPRQGALLSALLTLGALLPLWWLAIREYEARLLAEERTAIAAQIEPYEDALMASVHQKLALLGALKSFVEAELAEGEHAFSTEHFEAFVSSISAYAVGIRRFAVAPAGVVRYVYPLAGSEDLVGRDLLREERRSVRADIQRALESEGPVLSAPYRLSEGVWAVTAWQAIYHEGAYWGLVSLVVELPPLMEEAWAEASSLEVALRDSGGHLLYGSGAVFAADPVIAVVELPGIDWEMAGIPRGGWEAAIMPQVWWARLGTLPIVLLTAMLAYLGTNRQMRLRLAVEERTAELMQANNSLRESEERYRRLAENARDLIYRYRLYPTRGFEYVNPAATAIVGYTPEEHYADPDLGFKIIHPDDRSKLQQVASGEGLGKPVQLRWVHKDGRIIWTEQINVPIYDEGGTLVALEGIARDITQSRQAEEELRRLARAYQMLSRCNQALAHATDEVGLLKEVCRVLTEVGGYRMAWVGYINREDAEKKVQPVAWAGYEEGYTGLLSIRWDDSPRGRGPTGTAIRTGKPSVMRHILTDPAFEPWRAEAVQRGYGSSVSLPLLEGGQPFGALNIYSGSPDAFSEDEVALLAGLATDLAYGVRSLRARAEAQRAEEALRESEERFRLVTEGALAGVYIIQDGKFRYVNPALAQIFGYAVHEIVGHLGPLDLTHPDDRPMVMENIRRRIAGEVEATFYAFRGLCKDGRIIRCEVLGRRGEYQGRPAIFGTLLDVTERWRAEEALRESEERYRVLVENSPVGIWHVDREGYTLYANRVMCDLLEVTGPEELTGITYRTFYTPEALARVEEERAKRWKGESSTYEVELIGRRGTKRQVLISAGPLFSAEGEVHSILATVVDITALKEAEARIHRLLEQQMALNRLALMLGEVYDASRLYPIVYEQVRALMDADTFIISSYERSERLIRAIFAVSDGQVLDASALPPVRVPEERESTPGCVVHTGEPLYIPDLQAMMEQEDMPPLIPARHSVVHKEGPLTHSALFAPMKVEGRVIGVMQVQSYRQDAYTPEDLDLLSGIANVTAIALQNARLYAELEAYSGFLEQAVWDATAEMREAKERVEAILNNSPDAILLLSAKGAIEMANPAFTTLFGHDLEEAVGQSPVGLLEPASAAQLQEALHEVLRTRQIKRLEVVARRKDGSTFDAEAALAPLRLGKWPTGVVCILRDISPFKEVARLKDEFVSTAAHELRTPLTSIRGFSEILLTRDLDETRRMRYLNLIAAQSVQLANLIDDLLDVARIEAGRAISLNCTWVEIGAIIRQAAQPFAETSPNHRFRFEGLDGAPPVYADAFRLEQVMRNLYSNAVKYSPQGGDVVTRLRVVDDALEISVQDQGIGLRPEHRERIFEKFFRVDASDSAPSGTGLGLTICKQIVELHGGRIWVESRYGVGSTLYFTLPLRHKEEEHGAAADQDHPDRG